MVTWTDVLAAGSSTVAALVVILAFGVAWRQLHLARADREDRTRPFVVIDFTFPEDSQLIYLAIRNVGATMARDVQFEFTPRLENSFTSNERLTPVGEWSIFKEGIPTLAPGKEIRFLFDDWIQRGDLRDRYDVTVRYSRDSKNHYSDLQVLDLGTYRHLLHVERKSIHHVHEQLKKIEKTLHGFKASGGGLLVITPEEVRSRHGRWMDSAQRTEAAPPKGTNN